MPSFACSSSIRVASQDHVLRLKITHNLVHGSPSDAIHNVKGRLPKELDVLWLSDLTISLSGSLDGHQIPAHDIARSGLVHHLQAHLKAACLQYHHLFVHSYLSRTQIDSVSTMCRVCLSMTQTTFRNVGHTSSSSLLVSDPVFQVTLTPSRPLPHVSRPHANLVSLHLDYTWKTVAGHDDIVNSSHLVEEIDPFSPTLFLPAEALLNRVTEQFLIYHLVGRYPLIFGPWCKRLDLEMQYFPSIGHSVMEIMTRSQNPRFLSKCKRLIRIARGHHKLVHQTCTAALTSLCTDDAASEISEKEQDNLPVTPALTNEQILCESMEQLFRVGVPQRRFKPAATPQFVILPQDDDSLLSCTPDAGINDEASWVELPEIATSPVADSYQRLSEDMDVFATEGWPEDEMWRLHGANASPVERESDVQSDESLISASFPLASITTRSPQACSFALYHHPDVEFHDCDLAASGLRDNASRLDRLEDPGSSALFANLTHSPSQVLHKPTMQELGNYQVGSESFEILDGFLEGDDADSVLLDWDDDLC